MGQGGGESIIDESILNLSGPNAIVDWVFVTLRAKNDSTQGGSKQICLNSAGTEI